MKKTASILLGLVGVLHLPPILGVLSAEQLQSMYGVNVDTPDLAALMRHRAALFAIAGGVMVLGAFKERYRTMGLVVGFTTVLSFLAVVWLEGEVGPAVARVALADTVGLGMLVLSAALFWRSDRNSD